MQLRKTLVAASVAFALAASPMHAARAGIIGKAFVLGTIVVGGVALNKAQAAKHCSESPSDAQCAKIKGTEADPAIAGAAPTAAPAIGSAPKPAKDPNAMIDAGAAKAKDAAAKASAWFARKKAEHAAKKAAKEAAAAQAPGSAPAVPAPAAAK